jgi:neurofibromin 1
LSLVTAISTACPSSEVEELTVSLLNIFESRGLTFELMEALIKQEIEDTGTSQIRGSKISRGANPILV